MAQFVVRDLEEEVKARLKRRAERHGRSMEEEIRHILRNAAKESGRPITSLGFPHCGEVCVALVDDRPA